MGPDGHTCSLFPENILFTHPSLIANRIVFSITDSPKPPPQRFTLTLNYVNNSNHLLFFTCGANKAEILKRIFDNDLTLPCANVKPNNQHGVLKWFMDKDASKLL